MRVAAVQSFLGLTFGRAAGPAGSIVLGRLADILNFIQF